MEIKKIGYSHRHGLSVELFEPGSLRLNVEEAIVLLLMIDSELDQAEMDEAFKPEEQETIRKYMEHCHKKLARLSQEYDKRPSAKKIHRKLKTRLAWYFECIQAGWLKVAEDFLGWRLPKVQTEPFIDRYVRFLLDDPYCKRLVFEKAFKEHGLASRYLMVRVEARYGAFEVEPASLDSI